jgi:hypothetical protein
MGQWRSGDTLIVRNIARSDGSVTTALPSIVIRDEPNVLALYIPKGTLFKDNWVVSAEQRVASVTAIVPSAQRQFRDRVCQTNSIRLYLPNRGYSVGLVFNEQDQFVSWYGNLEAPFVRTVLGIDTRDFALDIVAMPDGRWRWKDEDEFKRRLELGIDSPEHQERVRAAGWDFVRRLEDGAWPFNGVWEKWHPLERWQPRNLPQNWAADFGSHKQLSLAWRNITHR